MKCPDYTLTTPASSSTQAAQDSCDKYDSDDWIIELLKKEALEKEHASASIGIKAFLKKKGHTQITHTLNKRFLAKMVREVDTHNIALIRKENREAARRLRMLCRRTSVQRHKEECNQAQDLYIDRRRSPPQHRRSITFVKQGELPLNTSNAGHNHVALPDTHLQQKDSPPHSQPLIGPPVPSSSTHSDFSFHSTGKSMLDLHFDPDYDPKLDIAISSDKNDDWNIIFEAIKDREQWKESRTQRQTQSKFPTQIISKITDEYFPVYSKGLREWDRGKVVQENGDIEIKALGWS